MNSQKKEWDLNDYQHIPQGLFGTKVIGICSESRYNNMRLLMNQHVLDFVCGKDVTPFLESFLLHVRVHHTVRRKKRTAWHHKIMYYGCISNRGFSHGVMPNTCKFNELVNTLLKVVITLVYFHVKYICKGKGVIGFITLCQHQTNWSWYSCYLPEKPLLETLIPFTYLITRLKYLSTSHGPIHPTDRSISNSGA